MPPEESGSNRVITVVLPDWLKALRPVATTLVTFGKNPFAFVTTIISVWVSSLFLDLFGLLTGAVLWVFDGFASIFDLARLFLVGGFGSVGLELLNIVTGLGQQVNQGLQALGPAAPLVVGLLAGIVLYGLYRLLIALLGEVPGGSTFVDFLRLR